VPAQLGFQRHHHRMVFCENLRHNADCDNTDSRKRVATKRIRKHTTVTARLLQNQHKRHTADGRSSVTRIQPWQTSNDRLLQTAAPNDQFFSHDLATDTAAHAAHTRLPSGSASQHDLAREARRSYSSCFIVFRHAPRLMTNHSRV